MRRTWVLLPVAMVLCCAGAFLSAQLLNKHMFKSSGVQWLDAMCESDDGGMSCDEVLASRWGVFPPGAKVPAPGEDAEPSDTESERHRGMPVAYLGLAYFTFLLVWFACVGRCDYSRRFWHLIPLGLNALGLVGSIGFVYVMFGELEVWCPLCVATHVLNLLLALTNGLLWPRKGAATASDASPVRMHPSFRLAVVVILLGLILANLEFQTAAKQSLQRVNTRLTASLDEVRSSARSLIAMYQNSPKHDISVRSDDPIRYNGERLPRLVLWSDFECPHCRQFARDLEGKYLKHFDGFLRVVFKHYPQSNECNSYMEHAGHKSACKAARLAEAVRLRGGNEKFWEAHDLFFDNQKRLKSLDAAAVAAKLGLDPVLLLTDLNSEIISRRIEEDIEEGRRVGVRSTPAVFLSGRRVSPLALNFEEFWKSMGRSYQAVRAKRQRATAKRQADHRE